MLILTVFQRGIGFVRGVWFCRLLDDVALGKWAMSFAFLSLVTPMFLFGLPGSLPRFVELYRQKGQLFSFILRVCLATGAVVALGVGLIFTFPQSISEAIFDSPDDVGLVHVLGISLIAIVTMNFVDDLLRGLRLSRLSSILQFSQSVTFTVLGISALHLGYGISGLIIALGIAAIVGMVPAVWGMIRSGGIERPDETSAFDNGAMWRRILPYAASIWMMNLLANTFELTDRLMLLHFSPGGELAGEHAVGQYHSGMLLPVLIFSLSLMGSGMVLPYLSADWEAGRHRHVRRKMKQSLIFASLGFTAFGIASLLFAPLLFEQLLAGKYPGAREVLPLCLLLATWGGLGYVAQNYLFVIEKGKAVAIILAGALVTNIILNATLVPWIGLQGAVWATAISYLLVLLGNYAFMARNGYRIDSSLVWVTALPASMLAGWAGAVAAMAVCVVANAAIRFHMRKVWNLVGCQFRAYAR